MDTVADLFDVVSSNHLILPQPPRLLPLSTSTSPFSSRPTSLPALSSPFSTPPSPREACLKSRERRRRVRKC
jgi:hypothetical protein